jgi:hypothetical protein
MKGNMFDESRIANLDAAIAACQPVRQANLKELGYGG